MEPGSRRDGKLDAVTHREVAEKLDGLSKQQMHALLSFCMGPTRDALRDALNLFAKRHMVRLTDREIETLGEMKK